MMDLVQGDVVHIEFGTLLFDSFLKKKVIFLEKTSERHRIRNKSIK